MKTRGREAYLKRWLHEIYEEDIKFFGQMNGMYFR